jgi:DUF4097 and DUF4098 domain-containing protein YvlB
MARHDFHTPGPVELEIKIPSGDIDVQTVDGEEATVELDGPDKLVEQTVVGLDGNRLRVELEGGRGGFGITIAFGDFSIGRTPLRVRARVPHGSRTELSTATADMVVRGRVGALETKSASGHLSVEAEIEGDAVVKTVSGDVRLRSVGRELRVQTVSGDVSAGAIGGNVVAKSVSGNLRFDSTREGHVRVQSVSGDIRVGVAPGTNLDVDAGSVSGDLASEVPLGSDVGAVGEGPLLVVRGKTVSGDFKVFRAT